MRREFQAFFSKLLHLLPRAWAVGMAAGLALSAAGCQKPGHVRESVPAVSSSEDAFQCAVFYYDYSDVYVSSVRAELNRFLVMKGLPYVEFDAASSQSTQNAQVESAIAAGAKLLIVNIVKSGSSDVSDVICLKAERAGIPVIFFNRSIESDGDEGVILDYYDSVAFVGTDPAEAGHLQGEMIGKYLLSHFAKTDINQDGQISYVLFKGEAKNVEAIYRTKYAVEDANALLSSAGFAPLYYFNPDSVDHFQLDLTGRWAMTSAQDYMMTDLSRFNEAEGNMIELVIANSDNLAEGAIRSLQAVGYNLPDEEDSRFIPVFGVDATVSARQRIAEGVMTGTVKQDAVGMAGCIAHMAGNACEGRDLTAGTEAYQHDTEHDLYNKIYIPYEIYDPEKDDGSDHPMEEVDENGELMIPEE